MTGSIQPIDPLIGLKQLADESVPLAIAVPLFPFNAPDSSSGFSSGFSSVCWIEEIARILTPNGSFWLAAGDETAAEWKLAAVKAGFSLRNWIIWHYTFGIRSMRRFTQSHRHLLYFVRNESDFTFNTEAIRVPSARQLVYGDRRANPSGRVPDDTWLLRPEAIPGIYDADQDVWHFAHIGRSFHQRAQYYGGELPEAVAGRIIRTSSRPEETVLIPFLGSGTIASAAKKLNRNWIGFEADADLFEQAQSRIESVQAGDFLDAEEKSVHPVKKSKRKTRPKRETPLFDENGPEI